MDDLLPCPICGSPPLIGTTSGEGVPLVNVVCPSCTMSPRKGKPGRRTDVLSAWNEMVADESKREFIRER